MNSTSLTQFRTWIAEQGLDAFLVTQLQNRTYLSGWFNEDDEGSGLLLVSQQQQIVLTHKFYKEPAEKEAVGWQVIVPETREYGEAIVGSEERRGGKEGRSRGWPYH